jgi:hypothetical protein
MDLAAVNSCITGMMVVIVWLNEEFFARGDNFSPRMPCQWYVRGGGEGKRRIMIGQSVPPTPFGMAFGRLKLSPC